MKKIIKKIIVKLNLINILSIPLYFFRIFPIKDNRIIFENFTGKGYGDSPKYIAEKLLKENYELYWVVRKNVKNEFPNKIKSVKLYSLEFFYILATSKIWISNSRFDQYVVKRKNQFYIQTWHGGLALKKIEYDVYDKLSEYYHKVMKKDNNHIDVMISNSRFCTEMYRKAFKFNGEILEIGTPRNDILINNKGCFTKKIHDFLNVDDTTKILLYAPTFRTDYSSNPYNIDFKAIKSILEKNTNEKWIVAVKLHPRLKSSNNLIKQKDLTVDVTDYPDIQELISACDALITDYSSTMFEAMIADKPVIIYANDYNQYNNERGYYFKFNELPFPIATNNDELINILNKNYIDDIKNRYKVFQHKVGLIENGTASEIVCQLIKNKCKIEKDD